MTRQVTLNATLVVVEKMRELSMRRRKKFIVNRLKILVRTKKRHTRILGYDADLVIVDELSSIFDNFRSKLSVLPPVETRKQRRRREDFSDSLALLWSERMRNRPPMFKIDLEFEPDLKPMKVSWESTAPKDAIPDTYILDSAQYKKFKEALTKESTPFKPNSGLGLFMGIDLVENPNLDKNTIVTARKKPDGTMEIIGIDHFDV